MEIKVQQGTLGMGSPRNDAAGLVDNLRANFAFDLCVAASA